MWNTHFPLLMQGAKTCIHSTGFIIITATLCNLILSEWHKTESSTAAVNHCRAHGAKRSRYKLSPVQGQDKEKNPQNSYRTHLNSLCPRGLPHVRSQCVLTSHFTASACKNLCSTHSPVTFTMKYRVSLSRVLTAVQA